MSNNKFYSNIYPQSVYRNNRVTDIYNKIDTEVICLGISDNELKNILREKFWAEAKKVIDAMLPPELHEEAKKDKYIEDLSHQLGL